jgi:hypothetical protein
MALFDWLSTKKELDLPRIPAAAASRERYIFVIEG